MIGEISAVPHGIGKGTVQRKVGGIVYDLHQDDGLRVEPWDTAKFMAENIPVAVRWGRHEGLLFGERWVKRGTVYQGGAGVSRMGGASVQHAAKTYRPSHGGYPS